MFRTIADVEQAWTREAEGTQRVMEALTDASLSQAVAPESRTLGRLAWHVTLSVAEMLRRTGLDVAGPAEDAAVPGSAGEIAAAYAATSQAALAAIKAAWKDETLLQTDDMYGQTWPRGITVLALISHQAHHRGQMTVLMRQAGLRVPGVYGPAREDWAGMGAPPPEV